MFLYLVAEPHCDPHCQQLFVYAAYAHSERQGWLVMYQRCFIAHLASVAFLYPQHFLSYSQHSLDQNVPSSLQVLQNDMGTQTDVESHPHMGQPRDYHQECQDGSHCLESHEDQYYEDSHQTDYYGSAPEDIYHSSQEGTHGAGHQNGYYGSQDDEEECYQDDEEEHHQDGEEEFYQEGEQQSDTTGTMNTFAASLQGFNAKGAGEV